MSEDTTTTSTTEVDAAANAQTAPTEPVEADASVESTEETQPTEQTNTNEQKEDDVTSWAEKKGIKLDNPDDVKKLAKSYREAEKKMHESSQQASELKNVINEEAQSVVPEGDLQAIQQQMNILKANQAVNDFYAQNPDAKQYDEQMAELARENPQLAAGGIEALYAVAKVRGLQNGGEEQLKDEGGKQALQQLAQKQKVASPTTAATSATTSTGSITLEDVRGALDRGDKDWIFKHQKEIDLL